MCGHIGYVLRNLLFIMYTLVKRLLPKTFLSIWETALLVTGTDSDMPHTILVCFIEDVSNVCALELSLDPYVYSLRGTELLYRDLYIPKKK